MPVSGVRTGMLVVAALAAAPAWVSCSERRGRGACRRSSLRVNNAAAPSRSAVFTAWAARWKTLPALPACDRAVDTHQSCKLAGDARARLNAAVASRDSDADVVRALADLAASADAARVALRASSEPPVPTAAGRRRAAVPTAGASAAQILVPPADAMPPPVSGGRSGLPPELLGATGGSVAPYGGAAQLALRHLSAYARDGAPALRGEAAAQLGRLARERPNWSELARTLHEIPAVREGSGARRQAQGGERAAGRDATVGGFRHQRPKRRSPDALGQVAAPIDCQPATLLRCATFCISYTPCPPSGPGRVRRVIRGPARAEGGPG